MKKTVAYLITMLLISVSYGQSTTHQQYIHLKPGKFILSDNFKSHIKTINQINSHRLNKTAVNSKLSAKQKLDSIIFKTNSKDINTWSLKYKYEYLYDEYGNIIITILNDWDSDINDWIPRDKTDKSYNGFNKPFLETKSYWQVDSNQWVPFEKYEYEYYDDGNIKMETFMENGYSSNNWITKRKTEFNYDINNQLQLKVYSVWVADSNMLIACKAEEYAYNSFGKLDTYIEKGLNLITLLWVVTHKAIFTYNNSNQDSMILILKGGYANDSLRNYARREYFYNLNGFDKMETLAFWDNFQNQWRFESKQESNYDNSEKKILLIRSLWHSDLDWYQINKREFTYDNDENLKIYQYYTPKDSSNWQLGKEYNYNYDYNYTISECYFPIFESYLVEYIDHMNNKPTDYVMLYEEDGELYEENRIIYHYSDLNIGISEEITDDIVVYPNPTNGKLLILNNTDIKLNEIRIYNQLGKLVMHKNIISNSIDLSTLNQGIYIIEFVTEQSLIRKKIIVKK